MRKRLTVLMVVLALSIVSLAGVHTVFAGIYERNYVDDTSITGGINGGIWYSPASNPGVMYNEGIEFGEKSTENSSLFARTRLESYKDAGFDKFFDAEIDFLITDIPAGVKFGMVFARDTLLGMPVVGRANSSFIYFIKENNELSSGISKFDGSGKEVTVAAARNISDWVSEGESTFRMTVSVSADGGIVLNFKQSSAENTGEVTKDSAIFYENPDADLPIKGYIGFGQTGKASKVRITHVNINSLYNSAPENSNIYEDFSFSSFNLNELYTRAAGGQDSYIKAEDGGLTFKNVTNGYLSTKKIYSNFEMTVNLPYISREPVLMKTGNLLRQTLRE